MTRSRNDRNKRAFDLIISVPLFLFTLPIQRNAHLRHSDLRQSGTAKPSSAGRSTTAFMTV